MSLTQEMADPLEKHGAGQVSEIKSYVLAEFLMRGLIAFDIANTYKAQDHG